MNRDRFVLLTAECNHHTYGFILYDTIQCNKTYFESTVVDLLNGAISWKYTTETRGRIFDVGYSFRIGRIVHTVIATANTLEEIKYKVAYLYL